MPSEEQIDELIENCIWTRTTQNGIKGFLILGLNGGTLFLPHADRRIDEDIVDNKLTENHFPVGYYWSTLDYDSTETLGCARSLENSSLHYIERYEGLSVRAVCP